MNKTEIPDEHAGKGGSYVIENGKRVLQERAGYVAQPAPQARQDRPAKNIQPVNPKEGGE